MNKSIIFSLLFTLSFTACAKTASDNYFGEQQSSSKKEYESFRKNIAKAFENQTPKEWGENVSGVKTKLDTNEKIHYQMHQTNAKFGYEPLYTL